MKINKAKLQNFKGKTGTMELGAANLLVKENGKGKTALLSGIRLALLGYVPGDPALKTNPAICRLASGGEMATELFFDDGTSSRISYAQKKSAWKSEGLPPAWVEDAMRFLLDPASYFGKSLNERMAISLQLLAGKERYPAQVILESLRKIKLANSSDAAAEFVTKYAGKAAGLLEKHGSDALRLAALEEWLKASISTAKAYRERMNKTAQGVSALAGISHQLESLPSEEQFAAREKQLDDALAAAHKAIGALESKQDQFKNIVARQRQLNGFLSAVKSIPAMEEELEAIYETDAMYKRMEAEHKAAFETHTAEAKKLAAESEKIAAEFSPVMKKYDEETQEAGAWVSWASQKFPEGSYQARGQMFVDAHGWNREFTPAEIFIASARTITDEQYVAAADAMQRAAELAEARESVLALAEEEKTDMEASAISRKNYAASLKNTEAKLKEAKAHEPKQSEYEKELEEIETGTQVPADDTALNEGRALIENIKTERERVIQQKAERAEIVGKLKSADEARAEGEKAEIEGDVLAAMEKAVKAMRADYVDHSFDEALSVANRVTAGLTFDGNPLALCYHEGEIGTMRKGVFADLEAGFSGSERRAGVLAIGIALAAKCKFKLAIIDELSEFDEANKARFLLNLCALVEDGTIDQFIAVDTRWPEWPGKESPAILKLIS